MDSINATMEMKDNLWSRLREQTGLFHSDSEVITAIKKKEDKIEAETQCVDPEVAKMKGVIRNLEA